MGRLLHEEESYAIRGAVFEVYREMGCGFLEAVYQECLAKEFELRGIPYRAKQELTLTYKQDTLNTKYAPNFICYEKIVVELKAVRAMAPKHHDQLFNYLKATKFKLGFLSNLGNHPGVEIKRVVL